MQNTGSNAFSKLKDQLISSIEVTIEDQTYPLTSVLNMAYDKDREIRKKAYQAEINSYQDKEQAIAACLNGIKGEVLYTTKLRGYENELERTLINARMSKETLDVLLTVMQENLSVFRDYLKTKATALGYQNGLPWFELYAPVIEDHDSHPYEKSCQFIINQFSTFSEHLGTFAKKAIENNWIDVYPQSGKVGGAFCCNLHSIKESRFLLNYGDSFSDAITMAHELGHGFHGECLNDESILNSDYPMPIAETASTFCETIVTKAALKKANDQTKLSLLEDELSGATQVSSISTLDTYLKVVFLKKEETGCVCSVEEIKRTNDSGSKRCLWRWFRSSIPSSIYVDLETTLLLCRLFL